MTRLRLIVPLAVVPLALAACSSTASTAGSTSAAPSTATTVAVSAEIYPLAYYAEQVGGDRVTVTQIVPAGTPVHGYELSPAEVSALSEADLAITITSLAAAVDESVEAAAPANLVDVATVITPRESAASASGIDSHMWLNPADQPQIVDAIAKALTEIDPDGAETYAANAEALDTKFTDLDEAYTQGLASCERTTFIATHPAFGYLADEYGLTQIGVTGLDEEEEPSAAKLAQVKDAAEASGATMVLFSSTANPKTAQVLADELGLTTGTLSTIGAPPADKDYFMLANANLASFQQALSCS